MNLYRVNAIETHKKIVTYVVEASTPEEALEKANRREIDSVEEADWTADEEVESFKIVGKPTFLCDLDEPLTDEDFPKGWFQL